MIIKVEWIEDTYEKVDIINFLLSVIYKNEFDIKDKKIKHLFYLYLKILQSGYDAGNDIIDTLSYFLDLGISLETIITECRKIYHNDVLLHLFSKWSVIDKHSVGECNEKFVSFIEQHRKMITRFDLVLHFNLITSYDYAKNILVVGDYLKKYYNYMTTCADWIFDGKYSDDYFVVENILTWKELQLFVELGTILDRCKELESKQKVDTEEE